jgi:hypothetical protein
MSATAWSALANRFSAVAAEGEFDLWLYSNPQHLCPQGLTNSSLLFRSTDQRVKDHSGFEALAVAGAPTLTPEEFFRLNRFLWLSWVAGRFLAPAAKNPELDWLLAVRNQDSTAQGDSREVVLRRLVAASAGAARKHAEEGGAGGRSPATDSLLLQPGTWQRPLLTLRDSFTQHSAVQFDFHLELHSYTEPGLLGKGDAAVDIAQSYAIANGGGYNTLKSQQLIYWMAPEPGAQFVQFAEHGGRYLPVPLVPSIRLLPPGANPFGRKSRPEPLVSWMEFLWVANPASFPLCTDPDDPGARKSVWRGGNPFMASVLAIDQFIGGYSLETLGEFNRRVVEVCPWFDREDRAAALAAVEAAFTRSVAPATAGPRAPYTLGRLIADRREEHAASRGLGRAVEFDTPDHYTTESAYRRLEAHLNARGLDVTPTALLQLRGEVAHVRDCGSADADRMTLEEVADCLGCPGGRQPGRNGPMPSSIPSTGAGSPAPDSSFTLNDVRDLLRYKRKRAEFEDRFRSMTAAQGPTMPLDKAMNLTYWSAYNFPQPGRLTDEHAVELPVYRRLVKAARIEYGQELDEETLLLLVGEVAERCSRRVADLLTLPLDEYERLEKGEAEEEKRAGRPALAESDGPENRLKLNVYHHIAQRKQPRQGSKGLLPLLKQDKDFVQLVKDAGLDLTEDLIKAAIEYTRRNPADTKHES